MPSRRKDLTGKAIERRIAAGFGQGEGASYKPWLRISDVPSKGTCTIITGWRHGREHHLLSRNERNYFYCLEWQDDVEEVREQFPLLPLQRTLEIAASLGFKHPSDRGKPIVMTTDFLKTPTRCHLQFEVEAGMLLSDAVASGSLAPSKGFLRSFPKSSSIRFSTKRGSIATK